MTEEKHMILRQYLGIVSTHFYTLSNLMDCNIIYLEIAKKVYKVLTSLSQTHFHLATFFVEDKAITSED